MSCPRCGGGWPWTYGEEVCATCKAKVDATVGPFPAEPVIGSAEAVALAAKTIGGNPCGWCDAPSDGSICRECEEANLTASEPALAAPGAGDREPCKGGAWGTPDACLLHEGLPIAADGLCIEGRGGKAVPLATASFWRVEDAVHEFAHLERAQKDCAFANLLGALSVRLRYSEQPVCLQDLVEAALRAGAEVTP